MFGCVLIVLFYRVLQLDAGAVIASGAVVSRNVEPYAIMAGNPVIVQRSRLIIKKLHLL